MSSGQTSKWGGPGNAQVFGTIFTAIAAVVTAATVGGAVAAALTTAAAGAACATIVIWRRPRPWGRHTRLVVTLWAACAVALVVAAVFAAAVGRTNAAAQSAANGGDAGRPTLITSSSGYRLKPSDSVFTNDQDKVDLDTNCPGRGPTGIQVGPARCGENADLILDDTELVTWERQPRLALSPQGEPATHATCRELLSSRTIGSVDVRDLETGSGFCVRTDKGGIAAVRVESIGGASGMEISFDVWAS